MVGGYLASALGTPPSREAIRQIPLDTLVRAASDLVVEVQTAPDPAKWGSLALSLLPFAPTVDGAVLPQAPLDAITARQGSEVPLLIGSNLDEAAHQAGRPCTTPDRTTAQLTDKVTEVDGPAGDHA